ncbi:MAG: sigma-54 dependent transcriptional regulator [Acidobacteriota bacterium]
MSTRLLIVEDDDQLRELLLLSTSSDYEVEAFSNAEEALAYAAGATFDIAVVDMCLPGMSGVKLIPKLTRICSGIAIIAISAHATVEMAIEAMKHGAIDFLVKPFNMEELLNLLKLVTVRFAQSSATTREDTGSYQIVAQTQVMQELLEQIQAIAPFNTTVLITGETGTGKELLARAIHRQSPRIKRPFVALNCAAVPEQLLEDELFGHVKGAFTGAQNAREGRFEQADGGTLFLDEIGDMSLPLQAKLLRVLQEREFEKIGSSRTIKVDVRVIAATSADLERRIDEGSFRPDLYYRLNVVQLQLPPLRERADDIPLLAKSLLTRFCASAGLPTKDLDESVWPALMGYRWPGNIRQLQNAMERAAVLTGTKKMVCLKDLPDEVQKVASSSLGSSRFAFSAIKPELNQNVCFDTVVGEVERELLLQSLKKAGGNKMQAAKLLNMKRTTFVEKLKRLGIAESEMADTGS